MKRLVLAVMFLFMLSGVAFAGRMYTRVITSSDETVTSMVVTSGSSVYTHSFPMRSGEYFALGYKFTSVNGSPNGNIQLQQSTSLPDTEGATDTDWVVADTVSTIATGVTTETQHYTAISPAPLPYARLLIQTSGSETVSDTTVTLNLTVVE